MSRTRTRRIAAFLVSLACLALAPTGARATRLAPKTVDSPDAPPPAAAARPVDDAFGRVPMSFEPNVGQTDPSVRFVARSGGSTTFLTADETVLTLPSGDRRRALRMRFDGASSASRVEGEGQLEGTANYFVGDDPSRWRTDVPTYARVRRTEIYAGIDVVYYGNGGGLEYDIVVAPGADVAAVRLAVDGADEVGVDEASGDLVMRIGKRELRQRRPSVYQETPAGRAPVSCRYRTDRSGRVGFTVGTYDLALPLVVDPQIAYATYLGGSGYDIGYGIAVDGAGSAYVTGRTSSLDFPTLSPLSGDTNGFGFDDAFVAKLNAAGTSFVYSTYLGGSESDYSAAIRIDASGAAYVAGVTDSSDFPAVNQVPGGGGASDDTFVTKLSPAGNAIVHSSRLGGTSFDFIAGLAVDAAGAAYVVGQTESTDFPLANPLFGVHADGNYDAFVLELAPQGGSLVYSTYLGGNSFDYGQAIAVDVTGAAYVVGETGSSNFPIVNPLPGNTTVSGADAFVTKFAPSGTSLVYSTYLGGGGQDWGMGVAVGATGNAYVTGLTASADFPTVGPTFSPAASLSSEQAFVSKLGPAGNTLVYSTTVGGTSDTLGHSIAVDAAGAATVTGTTHSPDFPVVDPIDTSETGSDAFVFTLNPGATALVFSTFFGGSDFDEGQAVALGPSGSIYVAGETYSSDLPVQTPIDATFDGTIDAFVLKIAPCTLTCPANVVASSDPGQCGAAVAYPQPTGGCAATCSPASGSFFPKGTTTVTCTAGSSSCSFTVTVNDTQPPTIACPANRTIGNDPGVCGAVVTYPAPAVTDNCSGSTAPVCAPASGSFFAKGTTTVTCTATDAAGNAAGCSFTVTVNDTQPPAIACPANVMATAMVLQGTTVGATVTFPPPAVTDNCSGAAAPVCSPASGSFFAAGTTTVTCTATDGSGNVASCSFTVTVVTPFDVCVVDDASGDTLSLVTSAGTPLYRLWQLRRGGTVTAQGWAESLASIPGRSLVAYDHDSASVRMDETVNWGSRTATATVKTLATGATVTIRDRNTANDPPCH